MYTIKINSLINSLRILCFSCTFSITLSNAAFEEYVLYNQKTNQTLSVILFNNKINQCVLKDLLENSFVPHIQSKKPDAYWHFFIERRDYAFCTNVEELIGSYVKKTLPCTIFHRDLIMVSQSAQHALQQWLSSRFFIYDECEHFFSIDKKGKETSQTFHFSSSLKEALLSTVNYGFIVQRKHLVLIMLYKEEHVSYSVKQHNFQQALTEALAPLNFTQFFLQELPIGIALPLTQKYEEKKLQQTIQKKLTKKCDNSACCCINFENAIACNLCKTVVYCSSLCKRMHWKQEHRKKHLIDNNLLFQNAVIFLDK